MKKTYTIGAAVALALSGAISFAANDTAEVVSDDVISEQRANLAKSTNNAGFGPQSPRDIDSVDGENTRQFQMSPAFTSMNLCNIHFHESACLLYTSPSPRDQRGSRMPSSA